MIRLLADENFNNDVVRGLISRLPTVDLVRVQDVGLRGADDPAILEWAAREGRVLLTHDVTTMTAYAYERVAQYLPMPGVFAVPRTLATGIAIAEIVLIVELGLEGEWDGQVRHLPL